MNSAPSTDMSVTLPDEQIFKFPFPRFLKVKVKHFNETINQTLDTIAGVTQL